MVDFIVPDLSGVEGIIVDIDNTLYNYDRAHNIALTDVSERFQRVAPNLVSPEDFALRYRHHRTAVTKRLAGQGSCRSRLLAFQGLFEELGLENAAGFALDFDERYWNQHIDAMNPNTELSECLRAQHAEGKPICVITNMQASVQIRKIKKLGLQGIIGNFVSSEEIGCEKPDPRIFALALKKLGTRAETTIMIGDSRRHDIDGAQMSGLKTWQIRCFL